jgi:hypothetical protein
MPRRLVRTSAFLAKVAGLAAAAAAGYAAGVGYAEFAVVTLPLGG